MFFSLNWSAIITAFNVPAMKGSTMPRILRVNGVNGEPVGTDRSIHGVERILEDLSPGRYHVDEISSDPLSSGHTSRRWGIVIKRQDGSIVVEPDPWATS